MTLEAVAGSDPFLGECAPSFTALHWHGDAFELPGGAVHLAQSERTAVQAFRYGHSLGLVSHIEVDGAQVAAMSRAFGDELARAGVSAKELSEGASRHGADLRNNGIAVFRRFARLARGR